MTFTKKLKYFKFIRYRFHFIKKGKGFLLSLNTTPIKSHEIGLLRLFISRSSTARPYLFRRHNQQPTQWHSIYDAVGCTSESCSIHADMWASHYCKYVLILHRMAAIFYIGLTLCTIHVDSWLTRIELLTRWWSDRITRFLFRVWLHIRLGPFKRKIHNSSS